LTIPFNLNKEKTDITIFIPCLNEEKNILSVITTIDEALKYKKINCEVIVCDDASTDNSVEIVNDAILHFPQLNIRSVTNKVNRGLGFNYFRCSFAAKSKYYMLISGDDVTPAESIAKLIDCIGQADMIIPHSSKNDNRSKTRQNISRAFSFIINTITGNNINYYNGLVIHLTDNVKFWRSESIGFGYQAELICRLLHERASYLEVEIVNHERKWGTSNAFSLWNIFSVSNSLFHIFLRRLEYDVFKLITPGVAEISKDD
jgi:glycosyltransferase involved in cell wall biosynthesis